MIRVIFIVVWSMMLSYAGEYSTIKVMKLSQKGERIAKVMCDASKLPKGSGTIESLMETIKASGVCAEMNRRQLEAVAYFISNGMFHANKAHLHVPHNAKCPVCGMFVSKYPKWAALMEVSHKRYYFDGVKDMMKYYIFDGDFPYDRHKITQMLVSDYYTLEEIPAKEAYYVVDPDVFGPMGRELVPFKREESAKGFLKEHHGKRVVRFDQIDAKMVMALDGIEL